MEHYEPITDADGHRLAELVIALMMHMKEASGPGLLPLPVALLAAGLAMKGLAQVLSEIADEPATEADIDAMLVTAFERTLSSDISTTRASEAEIEELIAGSQAGPGAVRH